MDLEVLLRGLIIGFSFAAPVGPIGVLCIRRTLAEGRAVGLVSGLGAAVADGLYGAAAAFGLTFITSFLTGQQGWLRLIGGLFLCYLGWRTFRARPATQGAAVSGRGLLGAFGSTFVLTLTNPMTILSFVVVFAGLGAGAVGGDYAAAALLVLGVTLGSALWWLILSSGVGLFRARLTPRHLVWVNRLSGGIILLVGAATLGSLVA
jgi:threonine/homoserine/homoserine lactone efflux protein